MENKVTVNFNNVFNDIIKKFSFSKATTVKEFKNFLISMRSTDESESYFVRFCVDSNIITIDELLDSLRSHKLNYATIYLSFWETGLWGEDKPLLNLNDFHQFGKNKNIN